MVSCVEGASPGNFFVENWEGGRQRAGGRGASAPGGSGERARAHDLEAVAVAFGEDGRVRLRLHAREDVEEAVAEDEEAVDLDRQVLRGARARG